jgi:dynein light chain LC8-type
MASTMLKKGVPQVIRKKEEFKPPVIDYVDMPKEMQDFIIEKCEEVLSDYIHGEKRFFYECAESIKKSIEQKYKGSFHVIVGRDFGSFFSYEVSNCIQFWLAHFCVLIFKHG